MGRGEAKGEESWSRSASESEEGERSGSYAESRPVDPKPSELPVARVRRGDNPEEARTVLRCKAVGRAVGRGEMPSELGDSWFSPKCIEVQPARGGVYQVAHC